MAFAGSRLSLFEVISDQDIQSAGFIVKCFSLNPVMNPSPLDFNATTSSSDRQLRLNRIPGLLFLILVLTVIGLNTFELKKDLYKIRATRQIVPYIFYGLKFSGLAEILSQETHVGYLTDRNMDDTAAAMQFSQGQYLLAPIIFDFQNANHRYVVIDCSTDEASQDIIHKNNLRPLKKNHFGIYLTENPKAPKS